MDLILPQHIDSTMRAAFVQCPQKFKKEFLWGLRPPGLSIDLHAGACFATALEHLYIGVHLKNMTVRDALDYAHAAFALAWGDFEIPPFKKTGKTFDNMWDAVLEYVKRWDPLMDEVQPFPKPDGSPTIEYSFAVPLEPIKIGGGTLGSARGSIDVYDAAGEHEGCFPCHPSGEPFIYTGRFDMLGLHKPTGRPVIRDEKTTGKTPDSNWAEQWDFRAQFIGYTWACQQSGIDALRDLDTVHVRGISILKTKRDTIEAIKTYSNAARERWLEQLRRDLWRLRRSWDEGYFDYNMGDACTQYGNCVFLTSCTAPPEQEEAWLSDFAVRRWNPLLKNPVEGNQV